MTQALVNKGFHVVGLDVGYFRHCTLIPTKDSVDSIRCDIRDIAEEHVNGFDMVIHLAALSNDPLGEIQENTTFEVNYKAAVKVAQLAKTAKVRRFIFFSTQSIYGISTQVNELDEYESLKNPQTAYAKSKWEAELELSALATSDFEVVFVRPSTVFGWSTRLRSDIVFNNLIVNGLEKRVIEVHSDGTPWRPVVHIDDVCDFVLLLVDAPSTLIASKAFNLGLYRGNFQVAEIAKFAAECLGINGEIKYSTEKISDPRSYKVSFARAEHELGFVAKRTLLDGGNELLEHLSRANVPSTVLKTKTNRLAQLRVLLQSGMLDSELRNKV